MTGELFALMTRHSLLATARAADAPMLDARFVDGVRAARDSGTAGGWSRLFSARALWLDGQLAADEVPGWLSGLLIGEEIRSMLADATFAIAPALQLVGEASLCEHYRRALAEFSIATMPAHLDSAASGLWQMAVRAGLVTP